MSGYFPKTMFPEGPPPRLNPTTRNLCRDRILKGVGPAVFVKKTGETEFIVGGPVEVWAEDFYTSLTARREGWGNLDCTTENLIKRGIIQNPDAILETKKTKKKPKKSAKKKRKIK